MEIDPRALTEDGYLKDQDYLKNFPYGRYPTSFNGCGWVAIYNVEHAIGQSIAAEAVYEVMRKMLPYDGTQGTPFPTMAWCATMRSEIFPWRAFTGAEKP